VGTAWSTTEDESVVPGQSVNAAGYRVTYVEPRECPGSPKCSEAEQADTTKRMSFADLDVYRDGVLVARLSPAKFSYQRGQGQTTTEVGLLRGLLADLYIVLGPTEPGQQRALLQVHGNPLVSWIWVGVLVLVFGAAISLWPEVSLGRLGVWSTVRTSAAVAASAAMAIILASSMSVTGAALHRSGSMVRLTPSSQMAPSTPDRFDSRQVEP
jgi:cytochrome c-type biogenesis protein CcmF